MPQSNVLFVFPDQHRGERLGSRVDNPGGRTPNLDALAARGTAFTIVLTPSPLCSPARACLAHGRRYDAQPVKHNQRDVVRESAQPLSCDARWRRRGLVL